MQLLLLLQKLICEDEAAFGADRPDIQEKAADVRAIWDFLCNAARFNSGFKWGGVRRALWEEFLDKKLMSLLCAKNYGHPISLESYLAALPHASNLERIARESRNLLPLLNCISPQHWDRRDLFKNETLREVSATFENLDDTHLRYLRKLPCSILCKLHKHSKLRDVLDLLMGIRMQEKIPVAILRRVINHSWRPLAVPGIHGKMPGLQRIYRLYIRHCLDVWKQKGHKKLRPYLRNPHTLARIMDWFFAEGMERVQPDKNATWNSVSLASNAWHTQFEEARIRNLPEKPPPPTVEAWQNLLEETEIEGVSVRPLSSVAALEEEGKAMRHCVASYAQNCWRYNFRIFSLIETSRGIRSTLCICPEQAGRWKVYEHRGVKDCEVPPAVRKIGNIVCRLYAEAVRRQVQAGAMPDVQSGVAVSPACNLPGDLRLVQSIMEWAQFRHTPLTEEGAVKIAQRSGNSFNTAYLLLLQVRDFCAVQKKESIGAAEISNLFGGVS